MSESALSEAEPLFAASVSYQPGDLVQSIAVGECQAFVGEIVPTNGPNYVVRRVDGTEWLRSSLDLKRAVRPKRDRHEVGE